MLSFREQLARAVEISFILAQGAGGQNVNKVATCAQLRFDVANSPLLYERAREKILASGDTRLSKDGVLIIKAQEYRTQAKNREAALDRLCELIEWANQVQKKRRPTKPSRASQARRMDKKSQRGDIKKRRGKVDY